MRQLVALSQYNDLVQSPDGELHLNIPEPASSMGGELDETRGRGTVGLGGVAEPSYTVRREQSTPRNMHPSVATALSCLLTEQRAAVTFPCSGFRA